MQNASFEAFASKIGTVFKVPTKLSSVQWDKISRQKLFLAKSYHEPKASPGLAY